MPQSRSEIISVKVKENVTVLVEARSFGGEREVSDQLFDFQSVADTIEAITESIAATINKAPIQKGHRRVWGRSHGKIR